MDFSFSLLVLLAILTAVTPLAFHSTPTFTQPTLITPLLQPTSSRLKNVPSITVSTKATPEQCHNLSLRLCGGMDENGKPLDTFAYPELPDLKMGGVLVKSFLGSLDFTTKPPSDFESDSPVTLNEGDKLVFFSGSVDCELVQCCVRSLEGVEVNINRKVEGGLIVKRKKSGGGEEGGDGGEGEGEGDGKGRGERRVKAAKQEPVFTVKDVEKLVNADADGEFDLDDPFDVPEDFELIDDAPPPFSAIQLDNDIVDVSELLVQIVVSGLDPFPKKEGTAPIKLTFGDDF
ncbi:hypothetical protein TrLO_g3766 [Triparma laevis f. longispina]|uniref:Uncharacterized protein n=1 Tax=Triparma laevis f. longispina TaxID=1714387 RepID=A0A9W7FPV3_9STRA|nr:hypothetical protein TrLO_g3766 [Triparma laevis f. longispina]